VTGHLYAEVDPHTAIRAVFSDWECCEPTPERDGHSALRYEERRRAPGRIDGHGRRLIDLVVVAAGGYH